MFGRRKEPRPTLMEAMTSAAVRSAMRTAEHNPLMAQMQTEINTALHNANAAVLPTICPTCGAAVDTLALADDPDPVCRFCRNPLPVEHRGYQAMAVVGQLPVDAREAAVRGRADLVRVLQYGTPCRATVLNVVPLPGQVNAAGEPINLFVLQASMDGVAPWAVQVGIHVPPGAAALAVRGAHLPAKVIPGEEAAVAIDWQTALRGA